jgi:redox-sensitive bicupin YhaK (pirin superfamily)
MDILFEHALSINGFANLKERRYVMDEKHFGNHHDAEANAGMGNITYLADAFIRPHGQTHKHSHRNVDIITVLMRGRLEHQGTLGNGVVMNAGDIQVQRAGAVGFEHNEINPDNDFNRLIQIWALPQTPSNDARYDSYHCAEGEQKRVYSSVSNHVAKTSVDKKATTTVDILRPRTGAFLTFPDDILLFCGAGNIRANEHGASAQDIHNPALIKAKNLNIEIFNDAWLIAIQ